jgi:hypothetical protein
VVDVAVHDGAVSLVWVHSRNMKSSTIAHCLLCGVRYSACRHS